MSTKRVHKQKVLRDNIDGVTKPAIIRMARQAGVKSLDALCYEELRSVLRNHLEYVVGNAIVYTENRHAKTVNLSDVVNGLEQRGVHIATSSRIKQSTISSC